VAQASWRPLHHCPGAWRAAEGRSGGVLRLRYEEPPRWAEFVIGRAGATVDVYRAASTALDELFEFFLTQVLSCAMSERGLTCLHAGVVRIGGRAALLVGPKGAGKSTTAGAVGLRGHEILCDDVAAIAVGAAGITVLPGRSRVRLRADAALALAGDTPLAPVWRTADPDASKRRFEFARPAVEGPVDVAVVYVLARQVDPAPPPEVTPLDAIEALPLLMGHRHLAELGTSEGRRRDFATLAALVRGVPVRTLKRRQGLTTLDPVVDALIADVESLD
jgi:hypothetical protein